MPFLSKIIFLFLIRKRYELPTPPAGKMTDVAAWSECVDNSMAQLEHQRTRLFGKKTIISLLTMKITQVLTKEI
jgi:hypothetical protein